MIRLKPLTKIKRKLTEDPHWPLQPSENERLFRIEALLTLHYDCMPDEPVHYVLNLLSGPWIHDPSLRKKIVIGRAWIRIHSKKQLKEELDWYSTLDSSVRLFSVEEDSSQTNPFAHRYVQERKKAIKERFSVLEYEKKDRLTFARSGRYWFQHPNGNRVDIHIPKEWEQYIPEQDTIDSPKYSPRKREPLLIHWKDLQRAAERMDAIHPRNWVQVLNRIRFRLIQDGKLSRNVDSFWIDGNFHLVGMMGSGKSTFLSILINHLTLDRGLVLAFVTHRVDESVEYALELQNYGISAEAVMGKDRKRHQQQWFQTHGMTRSQFLLPSRTEKDIRFKNGLHRLGSLCALQGLLPREDRVPSGKEPCEALKKVGEDQNHLCPLRGMCSVHAGARYLAQQGQVYVINVHSLLQSPAPLEWTHEKMTMLEFLSQRVDLFLFDEADRTQKTIEEILSPEIPIASTQANNKQTWVETMGAQLSQHNTPEYSEVINKWNLLQPYVHNLITSLRNHETLKEWLKRPKNNINLYKEFSESISRDEAVRKQLVETFDAFCRNPFAANHSLSWLGLIQTLDSRIPEKTEDWLHVVSPQEAPFDPELRVKLQFGLLLTVFDWRKSDFLFHLQRHALSEPDLSFQTSTYTPWIPRSPLGMNMGYFYQHKTLHEMHCMGVGRWLLTHLTDLYRPINGEKGPHVVLTSATSWAPGSPMYHVDVQPHALLEPPDDEVQAIRNSSVEFLPQFNEEGEPTHISGTRDTQNKNQLLDAVAGLAKAKLKKVKKSLNGRKILLVTGNYEQTRWVTEYLNGISQWQDRVVGLISDQTEEQVLEGTSDKWWIRRGDIQLISRMDIDIVVASIRAIERGHNIVDQYGNADLGAAFFLVRPVHRPDDLRTLLMSLHRSYTKELGSVQDPGEWFDLQRKIIGEWNQRIQQLSGLDRMLEKAYVEMLWDLFVMVWQTVGRLVRGGNRCQVYFVDASFVPEGRHRKMLYDWHDMVLRPLFEESDSLTKELANILYAPAYAWFQQWGGKIHYASNR